VPCGLQAAQLGVARLHAVAEVTRIHVALALEGSLVDDYIESGNVALARRYRDAVRQEEDATRRLGDLVTHLGDSVQARYAELRRLQAAWHRAAERGLAAMDARDDRTTDPLQGEEYEDLLLGAARLDAAFGEDIAQNQARILAADRAQRWTTVSLGLAGLVGAGAVAFLAHRLRLDATELEMQRAELQRVSEGRARLMRGVSHDLKNPLHAIDGHAALLADGVLGPLAPAQADSVARIRRGVRSLLVLINDLLELSRAEAGHLTVAPQATDLAALLRETVEEHRGTARAAGHALELSIADDASPVVTDPERVRQVLGNLLTNAVKYTPDGGRIVVRAERRRCSDAADATRAGPWTVIEVDDTGPGIPADQLVTIFDEFSRLPAHADKPGAGLGLAIARRVARMLGGDLTAGSAPSGGARFTLWLPGARQS
jgi:signal transduction histidine kinase